MSDHANVLYRCIIMTWLDWKSDASILQNLFLSCLNRSRDLYSICCMYSYSCAQCWLSVAHGHFYFEGSTCLLYTHYLLLRLRSSAILVQYVLQVNQSGNASSLSLLTAAPHSFLASCDLSERLLKLVRKQAIYGIKHLYLYFEAQIFLW